MFTTPTPCECCWITPVQHSVSDSSPYCGTCRAHTYSLANLRTDHRQLVAAMIAEHSREIAQAKTAIEAREKAVVDVKAERDQLVKAIATDYLDSPSAALQALIGNAAMFDQQERTTSAYNARDRAMSAVWRMYDIHSEVLGDKCHCGKPLAACDEYKALAFFWETYHRWERRQIDLMEDGKHHGLPADHPASRKYFTDRFSWKGGRSTESEDHRARGA